AVLLALITLPIPFVPARAQAAAGQDPTPDSVPSLPEAPQPQNLVRPRPKTPPCRVVPASEAAGLSATAMATRTASSLAGVQVPVTHSESSHAGVPPELPPCPPQTTNWFARFLNGPQVKPLTPKEKALLAVRNVVDPFNAVTILGTAAVSVGSDSHSPYGPGMTGFGRYVGVSYTQDMTGEFFGTFLIPSIVHQDPHYHRMPSASYIKRIRHAIIQVVWTQGDNGKGMPNYANLVGFAIDDEISNLYVPGRQTDLSASTARYFTGLAIAPTDNFITEFLPDVARHIHVQVVLVQRIINQVAKTDGTTSQ
ncbi:MAG: hypothetical protein WB608_24530, partial [Terracidiphilus sp.]